MREEALAASMGNVALPEPRGPVSAALCDVLARRVPVHIIECLITESAHATRQSEDILFDEDLQLALFVFYELHYRGFCDVDENWAWNPRLLQARAEIEAAFEARLRRDVGPVPASATTANAVTDELFRMANTGGDPSVADYVFRRANIDQVSEFLVHKSIHQFKEADPHSWAVPRLQGRAKSALVEVEMDEHGNGRPGEAHADLFVHTLDEVGLDAGFGAYLEHLPAITLASVNLLSLFRLHRDLRGAALGHLAIYEMASSLPSAKYSQGLRRLGFGDRACAYFDEHVEAEADDVHERIDGRDIAGVLAESEPEMCGQVFFGAAAVCLVDDLLGTWQLQAWGAGQSSLRRPLEADTSTGGA